MGQQQNQRMISRLFALGAAVLFMASGVFFLFWTTVPSLAFPAADFISYEKGSVLLQCRISR
jgi:hypothetical protein